MNKFLNFICLKKNLNLSNKSVCKTELKINFMIPIILGLLS